uniref:Uncharacterized protein n=1 Tax=Chromera velia CCMP2878 TaxID=1169474 RepID=A0A0G4I826_9ALVE|eukprot:Cvel_11834.t1-p1 / transcript=Cvel_11834.t1 / gene=Cvel_11834 / organism=Chromera_velia_CCMP2878 / gene_product=hypothetical protein / transcript_product=hypothetical protein / location=Cvel_scaffold754:39833-47166(+) / protein_length=1759 / sequence_SO=supercontig / SO=protein_coding / is_pseudo=false
MERSKPVTAVPPESNVRVYLEGKAKRGRLSRAEPVMAMTASSELPEGTFCVSVAYVPWVASEGPEPRKQQLKKGRCARIRIPEGDEAVQSDLVSEVVRAAVEAFRLQMDPSHFVLLFAQRGGDRQEATLSELTRDAFLELHLRVRPWESETVGGSLTGEGGKGKGGPFDALKKRCECGFAREGKSGPECASCSAAWWGTASAYGCTFECVVWGEGEEYERPVWEHAGRLRRLLEVVGFGARPRPPCISETCPCGCANRQSPRVCLPAHYPVTLHRTFSPKKELGVPISIISKEGFSGEHEELKFLVVRATHDRKGRIVKTGCFEAVTEAKRMHAQACNLTITFLLKWIGRAKRQSKLQGDKDVTLHALALQTLFRFRDCGGFMDHDHLSFLVVNLPTWPNGTKSPPAWWLQEHAAARRDIDYWQKWEHEVGRQIDGLKKVYDGLVSGGSGEKPIVSVSSCVPSRMPPCSSCCFSSPSSSSSVNHSAPRAEAASASSAKEGSEEEGEKRDAVQGIICEIMEEPADSEEPESDSEAGEESQEDEEESQEEEDVCMPAGGGGGASSSSSSSSSCSPSACTSASACFRTFMSKNAFAPRSFRIGNPPSFPFFTPSGPPITKFESCPPVAQKPLTAEKEKDSRPFSPSAVPPIKSNKGKGKGKKGKGKKLVTPSSVPADSVDGAASAPSERPTAAAAQAPPYVSLTGTLERLREKDLEIPGIGALRVKERERATVTPGTGELKMTSKEVTIIRKGCYKSLSTKEIQEVFKRAEITRPKGATLTIRIKCRPMPRKSKKGFKKKDEEDEEEEKERPPPCRKKHAKAALRFQHRHTHRNRNKDSRRIQTRLPPQDLLPSSSRPLSSSPPPSKPKVGGSGDKPVSDAMPPIKFGEGVLRGTLLPAVGVGGLGDTQIPSSSSSTPTPCRVLDPALSTFTRPKKTFRPPCPDSTGKVRMQEKGLKHTSTVRRKQRRTHAPDPEKTPDCRYPPNHTTQPTYWIIPPVHLSGCHPLSAQKTFTPIPVDDFKRKERRPANPNNPNPQLQSVPVPQIHGQTSPPTRSPPPLLPLKSILPHARKRKFASTHTPNVLPPGAADPWEHCLRASAAAAAGPDSIPRERHLQVYRFCRGRGGGRTAEVLRFGRAVDLLNPPCFSFSAAKEIEKLGQTIDPDSAPILFSFGADFPPAAEAAGKETMCGRLGGIHMNTEGKKATPFPCPADHHRRTPVCGLGCGFCCWDLKASPGWAKGPVPPLSEGTGTRSRFAAGDDETPNPAFCAAASRLATLIPSPASSFAEGGGVEKEKRMEKGGDPPWLQQSEQQQQQKSGETKRKRYRTPPVQNPPPNSPRGWWVRPISQFLRTAPRHSAGANSDSEEEEAHVEGCECSMECRMAKLAMMADARLRKIMPAKNRDPAETFGLIRDGTCGPLSLKRTAPGPLDFFLPDPSTEFETEGSETDNEEEEEDDDFPSSARGCRPSIVDPSGGKRIRQVHGYTARQTTADKQQGGSSRRVGVHGGAQAEAGGEKKRIAHPLPPNTARARGAAATAERFSRDRERLQKKRQERLNAKQQQQQQCAQALKKGQGGKNEFVRSNELSPQSTTAAGSASSKTHNLPSSSSVVAPPEKEKERRAQYWETQNHASPGFWTCRFRDLSEEREIAARKERKERKKKRENGREKPPSRLIVMECGGEDEENEKPRSPTTESSERDPTPEQIWHRAVVELSGVCQAMKSYQARLDAWAQRKKKELEEEEEEEEKKKKAAGKGKKAGKGHK